MSTYDTSTAENSAITTNEIDKLTAREATNMQKTSLTALARTELDAAQKAPSGRSARTVFGGHEHQLRQTLIAMREGQELAEHANPGEATVQVLHGRVILTAGAESWSGWTGDLIIVPDAPHSLTAVEDSTVLLTVVKHR
ncbi:cupin domain-containing protein [Clavibacter sp. Sh2088]|uniref:cupin domain-containing protein n=1 Tax=Clavibacter sp. Sh2088 TaxID=3397676 RepID=UPI0039E17660